MTEQIFIKAFFDVVLQEKVPVIDERSYENILLNEKNALVRVIFKWDSHSDTSILGFVKIANYYNEVIIKHDTKFYIFHEKIYFVMSV